MSLFTCIGSKSFSYIYICMRHTYIYHMSLSIFINLFLVSLDMLLADRSFFVASKVFLRGRYGSLLSFGGLFGRTFGGPQLLWEKLPEKQIRDGNVVSFDLYFGLYLNIFEHIYCRPQLSWDIIPKKQIWDVDVGLF